MLKKIKRYTLNKKQEEELSKLAEKYCKHDDREYNSCLYHIFKPFIERLLEEENGHRSKKTSVT